MCDVNDQHRLIVALTPTHALTETGMKEEAYTDRCWISLHGVALNTPSDLQTLRDMAPPTSRAEWIQRLYTHYSQIPIPFPAETFGTITKEVLNNAMPTMVSVFSAMCLVAVIFYLRIR